MHSKFSYMSNAGDHSSREEHHYNMNFLKHLYLFYSFELTIASFLSSFTLYFHENIADKIAFFWEIGLSLIFCSILIVILTLCIDSFNRLPLSFIVYSIFVVFFAFSCSFLASFEKTHLFYFGLVTLNSISIAMYLLLQFNTFYLSSVETILIVFGSAVFPLLIFLMESNLSYVFLVVVWVFISLYGVFLHNGITRNVRNEIFNGTDEHPASSAIKVFIEGFLVFCRTEDVFGSSWGKRRHIGD